MRFTAYAGASTVLATGVIVRALHQRANFYSACVYISQSNACLMILTNLILLGVGGGMLGLQRLLYGPLRPIEVEQIYEKAWFAITETCLAMTIFREEVGGWFLVMFVSLLIGKVWGWIGEGRVDILEQQPPSNPRLFHARLSISLLLSTSFDLFLLNYSVQTVLQQARPNMMVMFAFEFAVLAVTSLSTAARYSISLHEAAVIKDQTKMKLAERRAGLRRDRARQDAREQGTEPGIAASISTSPDNGPEDLAADMDIDVPGWEDKGRWIFYLDLTTDFLKLILYLTFFFVLCMFYGMPIHIIRDVLLTIRSFWKRIADFVRYRHATKDMNERYPDATAEEIAREDVCIICREQMRPWYTGAIPETQAGPGALPDRIVATTVDERLRPKKLPCGHILHFACLRSWLERQQNCPTCRRPVIDPAEPRSGGGPLNFNQQAPAQQPVGPANGDGNRFHGAPQQAGEGQNRMRMYNIGPFRLGFGAVQDVDGFAQRFNDGQPPPYPQHQVALAGPDVRQTGFGIGLGRQPFAGAPSTVARFNLSNTQGQLQSIEQQLMREINSLRAQADQLHMVRALQGELARLRISQANQTRQPDWNIQTVQRNWQHNIQSPVINTIRTFGDNQQIPAIGAGHWRLPEGLILPEGWTLLPLQGLPNNMQNNIASLTPMQEPYTGGQLPMEPVALEQTRQVHGSGTSEAQTDEIGDERLDHHAKPSTNARASPELQAESPAAPWASNSPIYQSPSTDSAIQRSPSEAAVNVPEIVQTSMEPVERFISSVEPPQWGCGRNDETNNTVSPRIQSPVSGQSPQRRPKRLHETESSADGKGKARAVTVEDESDVVD